jgi:hypothetical protein
LPDVGRIAARQSQAVRELTAVATRNRIKAFAVGTSSAAVQVRRQKTVAIETPHAV